MEPTDEQMKTLFRLCYQLTKYYVPVYLVRMDERTRYMIVLAGQEFEIQIKEDGELEYL